MNSNRLTALEQLYDAVISALAQKVREGQATAADLAVARSMLRDAGVGADPSRPDEPTRALMDALNDLQADLQEPN